MSRISRSKMQDVAREAGVSTMTVSRALRDDGVVASGTRARILAAAARLDYAPNDNARALSSGRSGFVAVLVPSLNNPHFGGTVKALAEAVEPDGLQVLVGHTNYEAAREERLVADLLRRQPEAFVLTSDAHSRGTRDLLGRAGVPIVEIWDRPARPMGHVVGFSNRAAARAMTEHLIACGYRRIAYLGETGDRGTRGARRRQGFVDAIEVAGLGPARLVGIAPPPVSMLDGRAGLAAALARWPDLDAVFCVSDPCAFGALTEAQARGLRVPETFGVAGFGDFEVGRCCAPTLTTVLINPFCIGTLAGKIITDVRKAGHHGTEFVAMEVDVGIAARGSTRCSDDGRTTSRSDVRRPARPLANGRAEDDAGSPRRSLDSPAGFASLPGKQMTDNTEDDAQ